MGKTLIKIGPADRGRRMSLEEFEHAKVQEGYLYELSRGIITVVDVPKGPHALQLIAIRRQLSRYDVFHPGRIEGIMGSMECKLLIGDLESERHPDVAIYLSSPPDPKSKDFWSKWVPEIVIEIVSPSSRKRDYEEKPDEYLELGVQEYWIVDAPKRQMVVMRRSKDRWIKKTIRASRSLPHSPASRSGILVRGRLRSGRADLNHEPSSHNSGVNNRRTGPGTATTTTARHGAASPGNGLADRHPGAGSDRAPRLDSRAAASGSSRDDRGRIAGGAVRVQRRWSCPP